jgi:CheY-like chemotaxis protein
MRVNTCANSPAALAFARDAADAGAPVQLVIADAHMPGDDAFEFARRIRQIPQCAETPIILLTSASRSGDSARCTECGISAHLTKPVNAWELRGAISQALDGSAEERTDDDPINPGVTGRGPAAVGRKILLAEDNPVNQIVARRLLEGRGHQVVVASTGREAVEAVRREAFDLVLMDVQMPEMDGFEATAAIRCGEANAGWHIPIFAMTAHAMKGDDERCRGAGMDGYLSKPVRPVELYAIVDGCPVAPGTVGSANSL